MKHIAFDLGGSGGKMLLGEFTGERLQVRLLHRFQNHQLDLQGGLYWNALGIYEELCRGMAIAAGEGHAIASVGLDTFSNDFGFVDPNGRLLTQVRSYRDARTKRCANAIYARLSKEKLHQKTGNQNALFNTLMQLAAMGEEGQQYLFKHGNTMLLLPDLLGFFLTGEKGAEHSIASVTQMFSYQTGGWCRDILDAFAIPPEMLPPVRFSGTVLGELTPQVQRNLGAQGMRVVSVCEHDTASAVAALPTNQTDVAFISSGTWSLLGTEVDAPIVSEKTLAGNFAFEGGAEQTWRLLKNIMGLWLVQECKRDYALRGESYSYQQLETLALAAKPFVSLIDPDDELFYMPGDMLRKIALKCAQHGQTVPQTVGETIRCIIESLALKYRWALEQIEEITGKSLKAVYILGGGGQDNLLNQLAANACKRPVFAGINEAALCGNLLMQLHAYGEVASLAQGREVLARSFVLREFMPQESAVWDETYLRFLDLFQL